jgi:hypothetical protein
MLTGFYVVKITVNLMLQTDARGMHLILDV